MDDEHSCAGMVSWGKVRTSLVIDGVEEVRITGDDDKVSAVFRPGTGSAQDMHVLGSHFDTVVHYSRMQDPEEYERALAAAEMFPANEFVEGTTPVAA